MDGHFRAFSFVDRIAALVPGSSVRGHYQVPAGLAAFPASLVAEAVGQLAAWAAMAALHFTHRPVAGIANRIELHGAVRPGQLLELAADLESVDTETVAYQGSARANGQPVLELKDCLGPMLPVEDFDDPAALEQRFQQIRTEGATPEAFEGVPAPHLIPIPGEAPQTTRARLHVPADARFFQDHFPRRPVFPGSLLMHANLENAGRLAAAIPCPAGLAWSPRRISDVKLRTWIAPGETVDLTATRTSGGEEPLEIRVDSRIQQRLVGSARIEFLPRATP